MRINGQFGRSVLGISIGLAMVGASSLPVAAQSTQPLTWQQHIDRGGLQTGSSHLDQFKYDFDFPSEFRNGYVYQSFYGASQVGFYLLKTGLPSYPPLKRGGRGIDQELADTMVKQGKAIGLFWNLSNYAQRFADDKDIRAVGNGRTCYQILCIDAPSMNNSQVRRILLSQRPIEKSIKKSQKTIQELPDGNYLYGENPDPSASAKNYVVFRKMSNTLVGLQYYTNSGSLSCFAGESKNDKIINATKAYPIMGETPKWDFYRGETIDFHSINTNKADVKYQISFNKIPSFAVKRFQECQSIFADRTPTIEPPQPKPSNVPALHTPVQFPTQAEFDRVDKIARANPGKGLSNSDRNARQGLKGVWRRNNAPITFFLGGWQVKDGNQIYVYPSNQQRRVCVITQSNTQTQLSIGTVTGSELRYDGDKGLFLTRADGGDMVAARASKSSGLTPAFAIPGSATDLSDDTIESMKLAKCITELPGRIVAQKPVPQNSGATTANLAPIEISNLGCTENLKIPYCRSLSADSGILFETFNSTKKSDGSIDIKFIAFNRGSADALIEIYDAQGKLQEIQIIDGNKPPTGLLKTFGDMFGRYPLSFFSRYPVGDIRRDLEKANVNDRRLGKEPNEIEMTLPPGGSIKITKSSSYAQLYNTLMLSLDTSKLAQKSDFKSLTSYRQMAIRFVKESGKNTKINIFKSAPNAQAVFSLDFIDPRKMAEILQKFFAYSFTAEGKPLGEDPLKNPIVGGVADIVVDDVNEGIEVALKKYIGPVWERLAEASRTSGDAINIVAKASDLSHAITNGENGTITVRHRSK